MKSRGDNIKDYLKKIINQRLNNMDIIDKPEFVIEKPKNSDNGDYSSNVALLLTKTLQQNPMVIAEEIINQLSDDNIIKIEIKKPGFINFFVKKEYLLNNINVVLEKKDSYGTNEMGIGKKINIEFVSANPTGILHMGNARGGAYGDNIARLYKFSGYEVVKEYYINDAGNQVDNLALSIKARYLELCGKPGKIPEDGYHGKELISIAQSLYDEYNEALIEEDIEMFKTLGIDNLMLAIKRDLKEFRVEHDVFTSEKSIYRRQLIEKVLAILKENDYIYESEGATWLKATMFGAPRDAVIIKQNGLYTYLLPDIAYHYDKIQRGFDKLIDVLGTDHHGYEPIIKSGVEAIGYDQSILDIKLLQLVRLIKDNKEYKMSKRSGESTSLRDLIEKIGVNAARYFFASRSLDTQMDFDLDLATKKSNENPVFYVSYAYARICTILKDMDHNENIEKYITINTPEEYNVLEKVYEFSEVVINATNSKSPHLIANYVYDLASIFHVYYSNCRIISDDKKKTKESINLIKCVKQTLENALNLIGVIPPERM